MKANVFLRNKGLNHDFKIKGGDFDGTLLELLTEYSPSLQPISEEELTDEKIKKEAEKSYPNTSIYKEHGRAGYIHGMRTMRDRLLSRGVAKESEWISVEDRLPEHNQRCLVFSKDVNESDAHRIMTYGALASGFTSKVTYWQPLPKPPVK